MKRGGSQLGQLTLGLQEAPREAVQALAPGAVLLAGFALADEARLLAAVAEVTAAAPFRHLVTPGGLRMSVGMTNCGRLGWVSDRAGYRYAAVDPDSGRPWPEMPPPFRALATRAAAAGGFAAFEPDACLVNRYEPGARLTLHQDRDERDHGAPIVSVSLGLPATFLFGGDTRGGRPLRVPLVHGDVVVWGGPARLRFHGVAPVADGRHEQLGACRINLTFRKAA
jgi:alkylated DNA repair protein (DNA oxidative demethylase)